MADPHPPSPQPRSTDGRNLDPALGDQHGDGRNIDRTLGDEHGEAAAVIVRDPDDAWPLAHGADAVEPTIDRPPLDTYYDLPVIKAAPWKWYIPAYFYLSGLAGAAASLAGALELAAPDRILGSRLRSISALGDAAGAALLIADLGRPARFHHMLRVFRPTSPMNAGTWILSSAGATSMLSIAWAWRRRKPPVLLGIAGLVSGTLLSTYTGVLLGNTAVPLWSATRRRLPIWFAASSAASLSALLELAGPERPVVHFYSAVAKAAQLAASHAVERAARTEASGGPGGPGSPAPTEGVDAPLHRGRSGSLWRGATWLGIASLAATVLPGTRRRRWIAGALGTAAALLGRFAIIEAGRASAADPRATFGPQRNRRLEGAPAQRRG
ncbi:MAG TPA: NrfD/PsrC family molybdoenzyme membrane anchor subunit [Kofleriaceae bacterium]|nr:NrfD/PsrC family molybdoenzyme membrane anchor subunit [Kofleriaceae bacterium]